MFSTRFSVAFASLFVAALSGCSSGGGTPDAGCQAETDQAFCGRLGKNCDILSAFDNCGASRSVNCGTCDGTCQNNLCQSGTTGGTSGGTTGASTAGGGTGGSAAGTTTGLATTGGTTGGVDGGCTSTSCGGYLDILTASFVLDSFGSHGDSTLDPVVSEHLTMIVGFNGGMPTDAGAGQFTFLPSPVTISLSGEDAGVLAARALPPWTEDGGINVTESNAGNLALTLQPFDQSGAWFSLEFQCQSPESAGAALASTSCTESSVTLRYFGTPGFDELSSTNNATISLFAVDAG